MIYQPGDIFCTCAPNFASRMIVKATAWWSIDCRAEYSHAGVITSADGETFESRLGGVGKYNISDFAGMPLLVGRHKDMTPERYERAMTPIIEKYDGRAYPWWRIPLHLIPPIARRVGKGDYFVCSEVVTKLLRDSGLYPFARGWNPDNLADMIVYWRGWSIII